MVIFMSVLQVVQKLHAYRFLFLFRPIFFCIGVVVFKAGQKFFEELYKDIKTERFVIIIIAID